jgi:hypothetical protein
MSLPPYDRSVRDFERHYQVVLPDSVGQAAIGFRDGAWFRLNSGAPHSVPIRSAIIICPHAAGSIVQIVCWWMRENTRSPRALDLATELALAVGELARKAIEDDPLGMSITTLPAPSPSPIAASSFGSGSYPANPYPAAPYPAAPYPAAAAPYQANGAYPPYAGAAPMAAATTVLPQITPDMAPPAGMNPGLSQNPAFGGQSSVNAVQRPAGPVPNMPALPSGPAPRGPQNGAGGHYPNNPYPSRQAGGQTQFGGDRYDAGGRGTPLPPPRRPTPYDQPEPGRGNPYEPAEPARDEYFRESAPPPRRPAPYGQPDSSRGGERSDYTRPPQRPRADPPARAW